MAKQSKTDEDEESQDYPLARYFFLTYLYLTETPMFI